MKDISYAKAHKGMIVLTGLAGLAAAALVGIGEFALQFNLAGGYEDASYGFFARVSTERLTFGHFLAVLSAPLYVAGYWHLSKMLEPAGKRLAGLFFLFGAYAFMIGAVWIGQRVFLGLTVHEIEAGADLSSLLTAFASLNEPFVNVLRAAMLAVSAIWVYLIYFKGGTHYPRWMAIFCPIILLGGIFGVYFTGLPGGVYIFPVAMNAAHLVLFAMSLWAAARL